MSALHDQGIDQLVIPYRAAGHLLRDRLDDRRARRALAGPPCRAAQRAARRSPRSSQRSRTERRLLARRAGRDTDTVPAGPLRRCRARRRPRHRAHASSRRRAGAARGRLPTLTDRRSRLAVRAAASGVSRIARTRYSARFNATCQGQPGSRNAISSPPMRHRTVSGLVCDAEDLRDVDERGIADGMAMAVVHRLEPVDVQHPQGGATAAVVAGEGRPDGVVQHAAGGQPCQRVDGCLPTQLEHQRVLALAGADQQRGHRTAARPRRSRGP